MRPLAHAVPSDIVGAFRSRSLVAFDLGEASAHLPATQPRVSVTPTSGTKSRKSRGGSRRLVDVIWALLSDGRTYSTARPAIAAAAAA